MRQHTNRFSTTLLILTLPLAAVAGCQQTQEFATPRAVGPQQLTNQDLQARYANVFWKRHNVPDMKPLNYKKVAIAEFAVEFVTRKIEGNKTLSMDYSAFVMNRVPNQLYGMFCEELKGRGLEIVDARRVRSSRAFARLDTAGNGLSPDLNGVYLATSDTGRVKELSIYSIKDLAIVTGAGDADIEDVEREMLEELPADVVLRVRIRVGMFNGHPTIERGSNVWVLSRDVAGNLSADRSLVSNIRAIEAEADAFGRGHVVNVQVNRYDEGMLELFPAFVSMAFLSADSAQ